MPTLTANDKYTTSNWGEFPHPWNLVTKN